MTSETNDDQTEQAETGEQNDNDLADTSDGALQQAIDTADAMSSRADHLRLMLPDEDEDADPVETVTGKAASVSARLTTITIALERERNRRIEAGEWSLGGGDE